MYYSLIGAIALIILFISNHDVISIKRDKLSFIPAEYRDLLIAVAVFYMTDVFWGFFETMRMPTLLFIDTEAFFAAMALGIMLLTRYAVAYMDDNSVFSTVLRVSGIVYCCGVLLVTAVNIFLPIMFRIDESCGYYPGIGRYVTLGFQIVMLLLTSVYGFYGSAKTKGLAGKRYLTIGLFGIIMLLSISAQIFLPLLPLYSIGYMLGCSLLRAYIVENEREEYRADLEDALCREQKQSQELKTAWDLAYTDALTGAKSKLAYIERETDMDKSIANGTAGEFAFAEFDLNDLKSVNDTLGHEAGDRYIVEGVGLIKEFFKNSTVYRIGGDEFLSILEGEDYANRNEILSAFNDRVTKNLSDGGVIMSCGISEYMPGKDDNCKQIFVRADLLMYDLKKELKRQSQSSADA